MGSAFGCRRITRAGRRVGQGLHVSLAIVVGHDRRLVIVRYHNLGHAPHRFEACLHSVGTGRAKAMPTQIQAGTYSAVRHYLQAVRDLGTDEPLAVLAKMRATPVNDIFATGGYIREDGRMVHDMYFVQIKAPAESKDPWDLVKIIKTIPGDEAFRPLSESECPLLKKKS